MTQAGLDKAIKRNMGMEDDRGERTEKKFHEYYGNFCFPVASQKHCWEDNVTEADLHPIISVTGREEILEHVLILTLLGGKNNKNAFVLNDLSLLTSMCKPKTYVEKRGGGRGSWEK